MVGSISISFSFFPPKGKKVYILTKELDRFFFFPHLMFCCILSFDYHVFIGLEGPDAGLALVLESLEFCLKLRGSEASVLEDLSKAINLVHIRQDLVESGHALLNHAYRVQQEYER